MASTPPVKGRVEQSESQVLPPRQDAIPDGGWGWVCVGACFAINAFTWGVVAVCLPLLSLLFSRPRVYHDADIQFHTQKSYGVYLSFYLSSNAYPRASPIDFALIGGLNFAVAMLASPLVTTITRYFGSRPPMLIGVFLLAGGFIGASFASCVWHLYLTQGVLVGLGVGFTYLPSIAILPQWFERRRSTASAISAAGSGIGGLIFSLATGSMIESLSLPWALRITGIVTGCVNLVAVLLIRDRNHIVNPNHDGLHLGLLRQAEVQWLLSWVFIMLFGYIGIQFSISDFATSIGMKGMRANLVTAMLNVGTALGRPWIGLLCDRYGRIEVSGFLTLATGILCFGVWVPAQSLGVLLFFVIVDGAIYGVFWATIGPLCAEVIGLQELPALLSLAWITAIVPTLLGELITLTLRQPAKGSRQYIYAQVFIGTCYMLASLCLWQLRRLMRTRTGDR